jgi:alkanesulfonate monooxygenase SsuD/methylene tetrahydromethanopterin reductase-like flavin-dependent oxidoreductase (luciferase family)
VATVSIGLHGATPHDLIRELAPRIEAAGFATLWLNDTPRGDSLAGLAVAASVTSTLALGTGVIPLDRRSATTIADSLGDLPADRLVLGLGTGDARHGLALLTDSLAVLREHTRASLVVGALGPRTRRLAAELADGVLLSWLTPEAAIKAQAELHRDAAGRPVRGILYLRTTTDAAARTALELEAASYARYPAYAANFERLGISAIDATLDGSSAEALKNRLAQYTAAVDEVVLRAIVTEPTLDEYSRFIEAVEAAR